MIRHESDHKGPQPPAQLNGDETHASTASLSGSKLLAAEEQLDEDPGDENGDLHQDPRTLGEQQDDQEEMEKILEVLQRLDAPAISQRIKYIENWAAVLTIQENEILQTAMKLNIMGSLPKKDEKS